MVLAKLELKLLEYNNINDHTIKLMESKQLFYELIYSLGLIKLKTLKTYIKIYLKVDFIQLFKSSAEALILFN